MNAINIGQTIYRLYRSTLARLNNITAVPLYTSTGHTIYQSNQSSINNIVSPWILPSIGLHRRQQRHARHDERLHAWPYARSRHVTTQGHIRSRFTFTTTPISYWNINSTSTNDVEFTRENNTRTVSHKSQTHAASTIRVSGTLY